jgi:hypothetical protein
MNHTAKACYSVSALVAAGWEQRSRYDGMSVYDVESIANAAYNRMRQASELGRQNKASAKEIAEAHRQVAKAASKTIDDMKAGTVARRDLRAQVDLNIYRYARESKRTSPLFTAFGNSVLAQIERMLNTDTVADRLLEIRKAIPDLTENEDKQVVQRLDFALEQLGDRAEDWRSKLNPKKKIVPLTPVTGRGA